MRHWGICPLNYQLFNFSDYFRAAQTLTCAFLCSKNIQAYISVVVYWMNFVTFLCAIRKLFYLIFVPLLAANPGDTAVYSIYMKQLNTRIVCT